MLRSVALLLVAVVGVRGAGHVGSVDVFRGGLIEWTFEDTMYEISSKQSSSGGDRFFDPRSIEFRLPSPSRRFRLVTTFRLARNKNNRVRTFRVNGNTFKVRYNKKGRKVTRVTCKSGPSCPRKRNLFESEEEFLVEEVEESHSHRETQSMIDWTCDSCGDFWESICDTRGIGLLCDSKGTSAVSKLGDRFATRAVNTLCGAVSDVCGEFEEDGSEEICFFSFEAEECDVVVPEPSAEPTSGPTSFPTSSPTELDASAVEAAADFAGDVGNSLFGEDLGVTPVVVAPDGIQDGTLSIVSPSGSSVEVTAMEVEDVSNDPPSEVRSAAPSAVPVATPERTALAESVVSTRSTSLDTGDDSSGVAALAFEIDTSSIPGAGEGSQGTLLAMIGEDIFGNDLSTSRNLILEDVAMSPIHLRALEIQRSLQADNGCMSEIIAGVSDGQDSFPCPDGDGPRAIDSCTESAFEDSGAAALVAQAEAEKEARINAGLPARGECLETRARKAYFEFANLLAFSCFISDFIPAIEAGESFDDAISSFTECFGEFSTDVAQFGLRLVAICNGEFRTSVVFPAETQLALDNAAACATAREFVEDECFQCVPEGSLRF